MFFPCYVHCRRPRVKCDDGIHVVTAPWARENSRYTLLFDSYAMLLVEAMPVNQARKLLQISHTSLTGILRYWVHKAVDGMDLSDVTAICADDTSFKRGQSYVTVVSDLATRKCIDVEEGRDINTIERFSHKLEEKGGDCNKVTTFVSDMSSAYMSARSICFPNAMQVIDKFHVKQRLLEALDEVRRNEQGTAFSKSRRAGKKLLMIPEIKQNEHQKQRIAELSKQYPKTGRAYRMVQCLDEMYRCNTLSEARQAFNHLLSWLMRSRLEPMKKAAQTQNAYKDNILSYFKNRITNAIAEALNSLIQAAKRRARGYRTFEGYSCMIYLVVGKLRLDCPKLFS